MDSNRRSFLKKAGAAAVAVSAVPLGFGAASAAEAAEGRHPGGSAIRDVLAKRGFVAGKFALEIDGVVVGVLDDADGGRPYGRLIEVNANGDAITRKHIAGVKYEDITLTTGLGMSPAFYDWIKATFAHKPLRKNGAIIAADFNFRELGRINFFNGLITEIGFPALDAASKDACKMTLKVAPETTQVKKGSGQPIGFAIDPKVQKKWLPANFRLKIDGLDEACQRVNKIEALTVKQNVVAHEVGEPRVTQLEPTTLEYPNLVITFPESHAQQVQDWFDSFVIGRQNGQDKEKGGTLEYLAPDLKSDLGGLRFFQLGIFRLGEDEDDGSNIRRLKAELYCDEITFNVGGLPPG